MAPFVPVMSCKLFIFSHRLKFLFNISSYSRNIILKNKGAKIFPLSCFVSYQITEENFTYVILESKVLLLKS